ncbi:MAG: YceI family protein [Bacteroidales bacterium]|nr:YceI family protein [Bacteroidales bacterium]
MKKAYLIILAIIIAGSFEVLQAQTFKADPDKTVILWHGKKVGGDHTGNINLKSGEIIMNGNKPVSGTIVIDMATITNSDIENEAMRERLVNHLKSDDFFGADKFPEAKFEITGSEVNGSGDLLIKGNLTIKGISEPIEFVSKPDSTGDYMIFTGHIEIDRSLFDVRFGSKKFFANIADSAIDDIFTLDYELYLGK